MKKFNFPEEDHSITKESNKESLSPNSCIKLQHLAIAGRHQCHINLQSPGCNPFISARKYTCMPPPIASSATKILQKKPSTEDLPGLVASVPTYYQGVAGSNPRRQTYFTLQRGSVWFPQNNLDTSPAQWHNVSYGPRGHGLQVPAG